jgi:hypothetical protein
MQGHPEIQDSQLLMYRCKLYQDLLSHLGHVTRTTLLPLFLQEKAGLKPRLFDHHQHHLKGNFAQKFLSPIYLSANP